MASHRIFGPVRASPDGEPAEREYSHSEEESRRVSKWMSVLYVAIALAAPLVVYSGPDVMSSATPAIANAAIEGKLSLHRQAAPARPSAEPQAEAKRP